MTAPNSRLTRRRFGHLVAAATALKLAGRRALASPFGLPLGLQLYSVREQMATDLDGALAAVKAAGFVEVEAAALPKKTAREVRASLENAGLRCVSAHHAFADLSARFDEIIEYDHELGASSIICASPGYRSPDGQKTMTLDDWRYNADAFNSMAEKMAVSKLRFGYHNHIHEFAVIDGKTPYFELLRLTDPAKVSFELDCGWAVVAGVSPVEILKDHPSRINMLHVKDFILTGKPSPEANNAKVMELGKGTVDYHPIFAQAAKTQHIEHAFVEQEAFNLPWKESLKMDAIVMSGYSM